MGDEKPPLLLIAGPTASGKTAIALRLAEERSGTIINADASQVYADLPILSAMPGADEQARVPHRLFGDLDGATACTAALWAARAREAIRQAHDAGRLPILVGGTGLYQRTLLDGIAPVPDIAADIRAAVRALPLPALRLSLEREDPVMAARLHANDPQRSARALEVVRSTGISLADWQQRAPVGGLRNEVALDVRLVELARDELDARILARIGAMQSAGALDEVRRLQRRGLPSSLPVMRAIGVPPLLRLLEGDLTEEQAVERWALDTRQYARRQSTWYRNQKFGNKS